MTPTILSASALDNLQARAAHALRDLPALGGGVRWADQADAHAVVALVLEVRQLRLEVRQYRGARFLVDRAAANLEEARAVLAQARAVAATLVPEE